MAMATIAVPMATSMAGAEEPTAYRAVAPTDEAHIPPGAHTQIYNGEDSSVAEFPFIIGGLREGGTRPQGQTCTGAVVAPRKILTAAHCKDAAGEKSYLYGLDDLNAGGGSRIGVASYDKHPKYVNFDQGYDVAVVTTTSDIPVPNGQYAKFATSADTGLNSPGKQGVGVGYGKKDHNDDSRDVTVDKATFPIREPSNCNGVGAGFKEATMICAGFPDGNPTILPGDSGGPLIVDGKVVGVASWSRSDFHWYGVWGRLNNDMGDWVKEQVGNPGPGDGKFAISVSPSSLTVEPGKHVSATVTTTAGDGGPEDIALTASGLPEGAKATFQPATVKSGQTAKLTIETSSSTPKGKTSVTVNGAATSGSKAATVGLTVGSAAGEIAVAVNPGSGSARPGFFSTATISVTGGSGQLTLSASGPGLPFPPFFNPSTISSGGSSTMQLAAPFQPGSYQITITATDSGGVSGTGTYTLKVA